MNEVRTSPLAVTIAAPPGARSVWIRLFGDVDMGGEAALADAVECLLRSRPEVVVIDLIAVTFVCSTFANFVADVHAAVPHAALILCSPSRMARRVLAATGLDTIVIMPDDIEPTYACEPGDADRGDC